MLQYLFDRHRIFLFIYGSFVAFGLFIWFENAKGTTVLFFNQLHTTQLDAFFKFLSFLGEWPLWILAILIGLITRLGKGTIIVICLGLVSLLTNLFKKIIFSGWPRPGAFFGEDIQLNFVDGITLAYQNAFPSGHTASAFALLTVLMLLYSRWLLIDLFLLLIGVLVGLSRIYLVQHFLEDILAGSLLGIICAWIAFMIGKKWIKNTSWNDKSLVKKKIDFEEITIF